MLDSTGIFRLVFKMDELGLEILRIAFPAALALAADPIASLIDTAFIGHIGLLDFMCFLFRDLLNNRDYNLMFFSISDHFEIGPVELAAVGVSIAIFNQASRITVFPLVSITTSFVAEENTVGKNSNETPKDENSEKALVTNSETKVLENEDDVLENLEKGSAQNGGMKELIPDQDGMQL